MPYISSATWLNQHTALARAEQKSSDLQTALDAALAETQYWKTKAEQLLDAALLKRGETTTHVFSDPPNAPTNPVESIFRAMNKLEMDSRGTRSPGRRSDGAE